VNKGTLGFIGLRPCAPSLCWMVIGKARHQMEHHRCTSIRCPSDVVSAMSEDLAPCCRIRKPYPYSRRPPAPAPSAAALLVPAPAPALPTTPPPPRHRSSAASPRKGIGCCSLRRRLTARASPSSALALAARPPPFYDLWRFVIFSEIGNNLWTFLVSAIHKNNL